MGLLNYLTAHSLDEDYAARRRAARPRRRPRRRRPRGDLARGRRSWRWRSSACWSTTAGDADGSHRAGAADLARVPGRQVQERRERPGRRPGPGRCSSAARSTRDPHGLPRRVSDRGRALQEPAHPAGRRVRHRRGDRARGARSSSTTTRRAAPSARSCSTGPADPRQRAVVRRRRGGLDQRPAAHRTSARSGRPARPSPSTYRSLHAALHRHRDRGPGPAARAFRRVRRLGRGG